MKIAILGYGTIGSGVYEIIKNYPAEALQDLEVVSILDLPQNKDKASIITSDIGDIINDPTITCVVEAMGGIHPAYEFIVSALKSKKHVVTANKAVVAAHLETFLSLASEHGVRFLFEASTGGGIPWIASLQKATRVDQISQFYGIFNGTSNYILDAMYHQGEDFGDVLQKAQALGYAEADPSADIDGYDVQNKTVISSAIAFHTKIDMQAFPCFGIRNIKKEDIAYFKSKHLTMKYIGEACADDDSYEAFVMPNLFALETVEANVGSNFNIATLHGTSIGPLKFYGQGAGKLPTANAIIQDILDIQLAENKVAITLSNQLPYQAKQTNTFVIRSNKPIASDLIATVETFENLTYTHTKAIRADQLQTLVEAYQEDAIFVAKVANFEG